MADELPEKVLLRAASLAATSGFGLSMDTLNDFARLAIEEATGDLREELSHVLVDWNALVAAIGAPTNGGAMVALDRETKEET